jgi:hypothetical protein
MVGSILLVITDEAGLSFLYSKRCMIKLVTHERSAITDDTAPTGSVTDHGNSLFSSAPCLVVLGIWQRLVLQEASHFGVDMRLNSSTLSLKVHTTLDSCS